MESDSTPAAKTDESKVHLIKETDVDVLWIQADAVPGLRELAIELRPGKRQNPNARTIPLFEPGIIQIPTAQGIISLKVECWLSAAKRQPTFLTLG